MVIFALDPTQKRLVLRLKPCQTTDCASAELTPRVRFNYRLGPRGNLGFARKFTGSCLPCDTIPLCSLDLLVNARLTGILAGKGVRGTKTSHRRPLSGLPDPRRHTNSGLDFLGLIPQLPNCHPDGIPGIPSSLKTLSSSRWSRSSGQTLHACPDISSLHFSNPLTFPRPLRTL